MLKNINSIMVVIVISGMPGCGSSTTAKLLAKKLKLKHFSLGSLNKSQIEKLSRKKPETETERSIAMWKNKTGGSAKFHMDSDEFTKKVAKRGNVVIDAKLGITMLDRLYDFSVWLKAAKAMRIRRVAERDKISVSDAKKRLEQKESMERKNWKKIYGFDYFSQAKQADLIIDTGKHMPEEIVKIIIKEMNQ